MTFVVQSACTNCKYGDCVDVCPVDCFYQGPDQLYIDPTACVDCTACEPVCPVEAIVSDDRAEPEYLEKNARFAFSQTNRVFRKSDVQHGSDWDPSKANQ